MQTSNAIKKLTKEGYTITKDNNIINKYFATKKDEKDFIIFYAQNDEVIIIDVANIDNPDEPITDYHAGTFCNNITQAINLIKKCKSF